MMLLKALALAASAAAVLVVPDVTKAKATDTNEDGVLRILPIETLAPIITISKAGISIPCHECKGRNTQILVDLSIKDKTLIFNGNEIYPSNDNHEHPKARIEGVGCSTVEELDYVFSTLLQADTGLVSITVKIFKVGDRVIDDIPTFTVYLMEMSPEGDIAMLGEIERESCGPDKKKNKHMGSHHGHKGNKDKDHKKKIKGCESTKCYIEQSVDEMWSEVASVLGISKSDHESKKGGKSHAGAHQDTDSYFNLVKALVLFILFCLFMAIVAVGSLGL